VSGGGLTGIAEQLVQWTQQHQDCNTNSVTALLVGRWRLNWCMLSPVVF
jgi:hypothetical protein